MTLKGGKILFSEPFSSENPLLLYPVLLVKFESIVLELFPLKYSLELLPLEVELLNP
jgi:hypothetical protein